MDIVVSLFLFLTGLTIGSFINAQVYRLAVRYKLIKNFQFSKSNFQKKRSFCDGCGKQLAWWENIPVVSWLFLGGKSKCCHEKLSILYPIVELATGILFLETLNPKLEILNNFQIQNFNFQNIILLVVVLAIIGFLMFSLVFDLRYMILPDFSTIVLVGLALVYNWLGASININNIVMAVGLFMFFGFLHLVTKGKGMGFGDVKLVFFIGLFLGWPGSIVAMYLAFIIGAIVAIGLMMFGGYGKKSLLPFGPFLILGTVMAWWWTDTIWKIWLSVLY